MPTGATSRLRAVPEAPRRALGMIRVSKERHGMVSPQVQQSAIADYCAARGYVVAGWLEGLDESGSRARSAWWPRLDQGVAAVEAGEYDVIVVWKFSRTARHRLRWAVAIDRVEAAGGALESATEQFDTTTSAGRLARGMLGELNAFEAERIGEGWKEAHARRVRAGLPPTGKPKYGYAYDPAAKQHVPDPVTGPILADLYRRYVAGESVYQLVRWLNARGHRTTVGGSWSDRSLRRVLDSGFASGRFYYQGVLHAGVHEPLIDGDLWQAYLDARERRRAAPARRERSQYVLSGLVRCGRCGGTMVAGQFGHAMAPKYRCRRGKEEGPEGCRGGYVMASYLERFVLEWLGTLAGQVDAGMHAALAAGVRRASARSEAERLRRELAAAEEALARLAVQNAQRPLPEQVFSKAVAELEEQIGQLTSVVEAAEADERRAVVDPAAAAAGLLEGWETTQVGMRRDTLGRLLAFVEVVSGRPAARLRVRTQWGTWWPEEAPGESSG